MHTRSYRQLIRRWLERGLTVLLVLLLVGFVPLWLTFQHKPGWYRPPLLDAEGLQRARAEAVAVADDVSDQMVRRKPFDLVLRDTEVNEWLAALPHAWPEVLDKLPPGISDLVVRFEADRIRIGAHCARNGWRAIVNGAVTLRLSPDGHDLQWRLEEVNGGSLPVPKGLLARFVEPAIASVRDGDEDSYHATLSEVSSLSALFDGVTSPNQFTWFNGRRPFRIAALRIEAGKLHLRIEPL